LAKSIRVNQLAKELGVESKQILAKCREEGLGEKVPNHMTVMSMGLAETVREWFSAGAGGGGGTAVEVAPPVETKPKKSKVAPKKKQVGEDSIPGSAESPPESNGDGHHAPPAETIQMEISPRMPEKPAEHPPVVAESKSETIKPLLSRTNRASLMPQFRRSFPQFQRLRWRYLRLRRLRRR
jgi:hypothetical protein